MKPTISGKYNYGSNPSLSAEFTSNNKGFKAGEVRQNEAHLVFSYVPGGADNETAMRNQLVKMHTTGKRWHVSYYYTGADGIRKRKRVYDYVNAEPQPDKRLSLLIELQTRVFNSLRQNFDYSQRSQEHTISIFQITEQIEVEKKAYLKENAYLAIVKNLKPFKKFLLETRLATSLPKDITRFDCVNYRNWLLQKGLSNRTVNNYMDELRTIFNYMIEKRDHVLDKNPMRNIGDLPSRSETHVAFTDTEMKTVFKHLAEHDTRLLLFIKFVSYVYLRPNEARLLQIKHFDLENKRITLTAGNAKVNNRVAKLIPKIFIDDLIKLDLSQYPNDYYLFGLKNTPQAKPVNSRYFRARFRGVKKKFNFSELHTLYGFRHTTVSQLIRAGKKWDEIMKLTGHTSMSSFQKYARSIMAVAPEDLSDGFAKM